MSKTVTIRLSEETHRLFKTYAKGDNRSLSNFIETAALRYVQEHQYVDDAEMAEISADKDLQDSLAKAHQDAKKRKGRLVG
ncbi:MAG: hypothetical protein N839_0008720 [Desulfofustis sp. PB-SRB1]|mgnify:CR=1 FL=1|nr:hypothetical protein [Desulfofustis sp. PB-SRB1]MBM1002484.1 hypothetical protein [Desulfofustis sp. PB-SRB1]HBH28038.1 CopG family transcriptional regulator [Desulfofustis sp.]HBH32502.1 CopG family transcriptional regulator [Desulfofustis sp.]